MSIKEKHSHYHKDVSKLDTIDVYRVLALFNVTDPCIQHAVKKLLVAGGRGAKDVSRDIREACDTLQRWQEMRAEDADEHGAVGAAQDRVFDLLLGGDPQAEKEARRYLQATRPDLYSGLQHRREGDMLLNPLEVMTSYQGSTVNLEHLPTGVTASVAVSPDRESNRRMAMQELGRLVRLETTVGRDGLQP